MQYGEDIEKTKRFKEDYKNSIDELILKRQQEIEDDRIENAKNIFKNSEDFREEFKNLLGWPLNENSPRMSADVETEKLSEEEGYTLYRMQFTILEKIKLTGLFVKMNGDEKKPLVIVQHGGSGTPELISGIYGDTANYNDMLQRVIKHKVHAFAPQLLLWNESYEVPFDRVKIDAMLKRIGSSITALEIYSIMTILDYFEKQDYVSRFGMVGLSYGGFYTLFTAAIDKRIKSALSCSFFNKRDAVAFPDWSWFNCAEKFDDAEIACLCYPRKLYLRMGDKDELFSEKESVWSFERIKSYCKDVGTDWVDFEIFEGNHEFLKDDALIEKLIKDITN